MTNTDLIITPEVWGPHGWKFIHYVTLAYPENPTPAQKEKYKAFLVLLKDVLPCSLCANHYAENLQKLPLSDEVLSSKENLIKWGIDIHNIVNESKNKPIVKYTEARRFIDTNVQCKANVKEVVKDNDNAQSYLETFANGEFKDLVNKKNPTTTSKSNGSCLSNNMNIVYGMIGLLIALVFIAVVYKKK
jgi:hypothetical protein